ncbi:MAG: glycosyltransferase [Muribaculaceae bacterium]|nr:glycosyltransferase [Muribaculaceae bacterium]
MKILHVITLSGVGGASAVVAQLSNALVELGHEIMVVAGEGDGKLFNLMDKRIKTRRIPSLVRRISPLNELKTLVALRDVYRQFKPDIIHLHSSKAGILGRVAFPASKIIYTVHGFDSIRLVYRKFLPLEKCLQKKCSAIVGVSRYDVRNLNAEGIKENVSYVYNGITRPEPLAEDPFKAWRGYRRIVLCIARLAAPKRHDLFIEVARRMPDCAFLWIGNHEEPDLEYPDNVFFIGSILSAGSYSRYADAFLLPTDYEGLPIVIIEAMANGTPVVASAVGGVPELLDGNTGFAVENNPDAMAERLRRIFNDEECRKKMSESARQTYEKTFTDGKMTDGYLRIYTKIHEKNKR